MVDTSVRLLVVACIGLGACAEVRLDPPAPADSELLLNDVVGRVVEDIERFWSVELPAVYGITFTPVDGVLPYRPSEPAELPPCGGLVAPTANYRNNAFYCDREDTVIYDDELLIPRLHREIGDYAVAVLMAHEYAHAIQARAGEGAAGIIRELQADCLAGAWVGSVGTGAGDLAFGPADGEEVVASYLDGRDPVATAEDERGTHGSAFDRLSAFTEGLDGGPAACAEYDTAPPPVATIEPGAVGEADPAEVTADLDDFWRLVAPALLGVEDPRPAFVASNEGLPSLDCGPEAAFEGVVVLCSGEATIVYDETLLDGLRARLGDATGWYPLVVARSQAVLLAAGADPGEPDFLTAAECLSGAFLGDVFLGNGQHVELAAGDLDEIVASMLEYQPVRPDFASGGPDPVLPRVGAIRRGFQDGVIACEVSAG